MLLGIYIKGPCNNVFPSDSFCVHFVWKVNVCREFSSHFKTSTAFHKCYLLLTNENLCLNLTG